MLCFEDHPTNEKKIIKFVKKQKKRMQNDEKKRMQNDEKKIDEKKKFFLIFKFI